MTTQEIMSKEEMVETLRYIKELKGATGTRYVDIHVTKKEKMVCGTRDSSGKVFSINLDNLYEAYCHCDPLTTPAVKQYIFMGHSPALAIIRLLRMLSRSTQ